MVGDLVKTEVNNIFRVGLHFRRRPLARSVVIDRLLEIAWRHTGEYGHGIAGTIAIETVARTAYERLRGTWCVERASAGVGVQRGQDETEDGDEGARVESGSNFGPNRRREKTYSLTHKNIFWSI